MRRGILIAIVAVVAVAITAGLMLPGQEEQPSETKVVAQVYYGMGCSCCEQYIQYLKQRGFAVDAKVSSDLTTVKANLGVPGTLASCHTSVIKGYFVEGHVPVEAINKLLKEKPDIDGIALPGMPSGSPGMGGVKTGPFVIYAVLNGQIAEFIVL